MPSDERRDRTTHHKNTKQRGQEEWTWEDILNGKGSWTWEEILAGRDRLPWEQTEAAILQGVTASTEAREAAPPPIFWGGSTRGDWRRQGLDLSQLPVLTVGSV